MDIQSWLLSGPGLGAAAVVLVAVLSVLVFMRTDLLKGKSYEEAVAEQRKAANELITLATGKPKFNAGKKNKKVGKKAKEKRSKEALVTGSEGESDALDSQADEPATSKGHVEFAEETIVEQAIEENKNVRKRGKGHKMKPILLNKADPSCVSDPSAPSSPDVYNNFEEIHPKDELELMQLSSVTDKTLEDKLAVEKKEGKAGKGKGQKNAKVVVVELTKEELTNDSPKEQRKGKKSEKKPAIEPVTELKEEIVPVFVQPEELITEKLLKQAAIEKPSAPVPPKPAKKNKKSEQSILSLISSNVEGLNVNELVRLLSAAVLSRSEIQILTDCLLNKQHGPLPQHSEWSEGPNDPVAKLKKTLADKEKALQEEQEASQAVHGKVKELRAQLNGERSRATAALRAQEAAEITVKARTHDVLLLQQRVSALAEDLQQLTQHNLQLQAQVKAECESAGQRSQLELAVQHLSESESLLKAELVARDQRLTAQQHQHAAQLQEAQRLLSEVEAEAQRGAGARAAHELLQARERVQELQTELGRLSSCIKQEQALKEEAEKKSQLYLNQLNKLKSDTETINAVAEQKLKSEIDALKSENENTKKLCEQLKSELEQRKSELNQLKNEKEQIKLEKEQMQEEKDEVRSGQESASEELKCRLEEVQLENKKLKVELEEARANISKISQQQHNGIASDAEKKVEAVKLLRSELEEAQAGNLLHRQHLDNLTTQLQAYKDKNNELRTKNWKVMDALQAAERYNARTTLHEEISKAREEQYLEIRRALERSCPQAAVADSNMSREIWLSTFVERLTQLSSTPVASSDNADDQLQELQKQNGQLKALVDNYKQVIAHTEGVLSRLQENVSTAEERWAKQLQDKQKELDSLKQHSITQMQSKIDSLQASLEQERRRAPNSTIAPTTSLADVERGIIEENARLKNISGKLQSGSHNGPESTSKTRNERIRIGKARPTLAGWLGRKITFRRKKEKHKRRSEESDADSEPRARLLCPSYKTLRRTHAHTHTHA